MKKRYFIIIIVLCLVAILFFMKNNLLSSKTEIKEQEEKILSETTTETVNNSDDDIYDVILFWGQSNMLGSARSGEEGDVDNRIVESSETFLSEEEFSKRSDIIPEIVHSYYSNTDKFFHRAVVDIEDGTLYDYKFCKDYVKNGKDITPGNCGTGYDSLVKITPNTKRIGQAFTGVRNVSDNIPPTEFKTIPNYYCNKLYGGGGVRTELYNEVEYLLPTFLSRSTITTNIIPYFGKTYYEKTGHKVVAVFVTVGGKSILEFNPNPPTNSIAYMYQAMIAKYNAAINYLEKNNMKIGNKFHISFQGEKDVTRNSDYYKEYKQVHDALIEDLNLQFGVLIETATTLERKNCENDDCGQVCYCEEDSCDENCSGNVGGFLKIHNAQERLIRDNDNLILGSDYTWKHYLPVKDFYCNNNNKSQFAIQNIDCDATEGANNSYEKALESIKLAFYTDNTHLNAAGLSQIGYDTANNVFNYILAAPTLKVSDGVESGKWHTKDVKIELSTTEDMQGKVDYYMWKNNENVENAVVLSNEVFEKKENDLGTVYHFRTCYKSDNSLCSNEISYKMLIDKSNPTVKLSNNENLTASTTHDVTIKIKDGESGLKSGGVVEYGWSTSLTNAPTKYNKETLKYTEGTTSEITFTVKGEDLAGKYYLWVKPNVKDVSGNVNNTIIKSTGQFSFYRTIEFPNCPDKTYTGASQTLYEAHTTGGYTNSALTGTTVKSYTVDLTPMTNYQWSSGSNVTSARTLTCNIVKSDTTTTLNAITKMYTGSAQEVSGASAKLSSNNSTITNAKFAYKYYTNNTCKTGEITTPIDAGTYYVQAILEGTTNYNSSTSGCVSYTISEEIGIINPNKVTLNSNKIIIEIKYNEILTYDELLKNIKITSSDVIIKNSKGIVITNDNQKALGTGSKIELNKKEYDIIVNGDINGDGKISTLDYVAIRNHLMDEPNKIINNDSITYLAADVHKDNKITTLDYIKIRKIMMDKT